MDNIAKKDKEDNQKSCGTTPERLMVKGTITSYSSGDIGSSTIVSLPYADGAAATLPYQNPRIVAENSRAASSSSVPPLSSSAPASVPVARAGSSVGAHAADYTPHTVVRQQSNVVPNGTALIQTAVNPGLMPNGVASIQTEAIPGSVPMQRQSAVGRPMHREAIPGLVPMQRQSAVRRHLHSS